MFQWAKAVPLQAAFFLLILFAVRWFSALRNIKTEDMYDKNVDH